MTDTDPPPSIEGPHQAIDASPDDEPDPLAIARLAACEITLQNPCGYPESAARRLHPWFAQVIAEMASEARSLTVRFVDDLEMRRINANFRAQDKPTDVLSFPGELLPGDPIQNNSDLGTLEADGWPVLGDVVGEEGLMGSGFLGDIVISVPTARRQAAAQGHSVERELQVLMLHGTLHCLGFDHEADDGEMEALEAKLRRRFIDQSPEALSLTFAEAGR